MSSPVPPNDPDFGQFQIPGLETGGTEDFSAKARAAADVTQTVNKMAEGTDALLQTLVTNMESLRQTMSALPDAFASTADHIKRGADAADKLAKNTERTVKANKSTEKSLDNQKFKIKELIGQLAHGNIGGAIGEAFQGVGPWGGSEGTFMTKARAKMGGLGEGSFLDRMAGRGVIGPVTAAGEGAAVPGLMARLGIARGAAGLAVAGSLFTPAAVFAVYKALGDANKAQQEARRVGGLTGEGRGAGFSAMGISIPFLGSIGGEAGHLRSNPFDLIGNRDAQEIVMGVRGSGFRGGQARAVEETIKNIVNDLGVGVQDAMTVAIPAIKDANFSTTQLRDTMDSLKQTAHDSTIGIGDLTKSLGDLITERAQTTRYGAALAPAQRNTLLAEFKGTPLGKDTAAVNSILSTQSVTNIAIQSGVSPLDITSKDFIDNFLNYFNKLVLRLALGNDAGNGETRWSWEMYVARLLTNPLIAQTFTMAPEKFADILRTAWQKSSKGKNPSGFLGKQAKANTVALATPNLNALKNISSDFHSKEMEVWGRSPGMAHHYDGKKDSLHIFSSVDQQIRAMNLGPAARAKFEAPLLKALKEGGANSSDINKALSHLGDRIVHTINNQPTTKIGLDPRTGRHLRLTTNAQANAAGRGEASQQGNSYLYP